MKRMTIRNSDSSVSQPTSSTVEDVLYRLADFEDLEMEPQVIRQLVADAADMEAQLDNWKNNGTSISEWIPNTDNWTPAVCCKVCGYNRPLVAGEKQEPMAFCNACGAKMINADDDMFVSV